MRTSIDQPDLISENSARFHEQLENEEYASTVMFREPEPQMNIRHEMRQFNDQGQIKNSDESPLVDRLKEMRNKRKAEKQLTDDFMSQIDQLNEVTSNILTKDSFMSEQNIEEESKIMTNLNPQNLMFEKRKQNKEIRSTLAPLVEELPQNTSFSIKKDEIDASLVEKKTPAPIKIRKRDIILKKQLNDTTEST